MTSVRSSVIDISFQKEARPDEDKTLDHNELDARGSVAHAGASQFGGIMARESGIKNQKWEVKKQTGCRKGQGPGTCAHAHMGNANAERLSSAQN